MSTLADIAAELPGYDPADLCVADATAFLEALAEPVQGTETLPLHEALGRVLAQDLVSPLSVPPHDNSAMDGYAFDGAALRPGQALQLRPVGQALAGRPWQGQVGPGECVRTMTGAVMPAGLDTVVPQELTTPGPDGTIAIAADVLRPGANRRLRGEDLQEGAIALQKGELLAPAAIGLAASLGLQTLDVARRLRVAYFSTGDEILRPGEPPRPGAIHDSNRATLTSLLARLGAQVIDLGAVPDDPAQIAAAFARAAAQADAVITSGGVSTGDADHTRAMLQQLGDVVSWRLAMRPGRPMVVGRIARALDAKTASIPCQPSAGSYENKSILFGLPGNPVAAMVCFLVLVRPALLRMMGARPQAIPYLQARSSEIIRKRPGRTEYPRGIVFTAPDGNLQVCTTGSQGSGMLSSMVRANGLLVLRHEQGDVAMGDLVDVMMFDAAM
ncbi:MAG: molybdopterin molybdenumtransferase MoeA [Comamonadaceae bacterium SCN 68-20]|nr:MAG: molybdopterin molybdenumtransferase MoeA [Comamonadaceae bacterium SCN 68-20]OJX16609.1 MAG: molybdopterin molybdenumtransferase MoeA [Burkholderiales bacterium 68-20]UJB64495.1 molybdopterin molybdotransferase MoeA [Acidovorax sp. YS12]